jgi:hypothetical protein
VVEESGPEPENGRPDDAPEAGSSEPTAGSSQPAPGSSEPAPGSSEPTAGSSEPTAGRVRLVDRYVRVRAATIERDAGPGRILRLAARAPAVTAVVLALVLGTVFAVTFGVPPVSPLFLVALLCAPVYPWLRLEARAIEAWQARDRGPGR